MSYERPHLIAVGGLRPIRWVQPYDQDPTWGVLDLMERELLAKVPDELDLQRVVSYVLIGRRVL